MTIYADEVFAINTVSNILLLYAYCVLYRIPVKKLRLIGAAALCGLYAVFDVALSLPWLIRIIAMLAMASVAFGFRYVVSHTLRLMFISVCVEAITLAGVIITGGSAVVRGVVTIFAKDIVAALIYVLSYPAIIVIRRIIQAKQKYKKVNIIYSGKEIDFIALYDSGNLLKYKGHSVIMVDWETAEGLFEYMDYAELEQNSTAFVMYNTLNGGGMVPVFEDIRCYINGISVNYVMAVTRRKFSGKYSGIIA